MTPHSPHARPFLADAFETANAAKEAENQGPSIPARVAHLRRHDLEPLPDDHGLWTRAARALIDAPAGAMVGIGPNALPAQTVALPTAEKAISLLTHDKTHPVRLNLAHALLFNGQFDKARALYAKYLGQSFEDGRKWNDELRGDFKLFREQGLTHPDMEKIEALLKPTSTNSAPAQQP